MKSFIKAVLTTTLVAGTLDILSAYVHVYILTHQVTKKMFHYIAGGALGPDNAMKGDWGVILLGIFIHYFIAFSFVLLFYLAYKKFKFDSINKYALGLLYGLFVWLVMNRVVLPLTKIPHHPFDLKNAIIGALILMFMIGIPTSLMAHIYFKRSIV